MKSIEFKMKDKKKYLKRFVREVVLPGVQDNRVRSTGTAYIHLTVM